MCFEKAPKTQAKLLLGDGLHFKIISFADMHEWTLTKLASDSV